MNETEPSQFRRVAGQVVLGSLGVALITGVCYPAHLNVGIPGFLYLLVVVLLSLTGGFASSAVVSVIAIACLNYFFVPPVLSFEIMEPVDGAAMLTFLVTSLVITRLASKVRDQYRATEAKRKDIALLYEVAARLLSLEPEVAAGAKYLRIFREVFALRAACLFDGSTAQARTDGESGRGLAERTRDAFIRGKDYRDGEHQLYIQCLHAAGKLTGAVGFEGHFDDESAVGPLSMLAVTALERTRSFRSASKAAAAVQTEVLRSAILDAFAHEFKTPLAVILTAAGGLRETGGLRSEQLEMTDIIETQTTRLSRLTTRLLRMARLDREEVKPRLEVINLYTLVTRLVDQYQNQEEDRVVSVKSSLTPVEVLADPELLNLALIQLLDNAVKYSQPGSAIAIDLDSEDGFADVRVKNEGRSIRPEEQERIFDRFYRGSDTEHRAPGTGLGLYVARKIVRAHGGTLELDRELSGGGTSFRLKLPVLDRGRQHERKAS